MNELLRTKKRVLVVDDDEETRHAIAALLRPRYDVVVAADGLEGVHAASTPPHPDVIVADVSMPRLDGLSMARVIKEMPALRRIPIIFLSARTSPANVVAGIMAGARNYLLKPVDPYVLETKLRRALVGDGQRGA